MLRPPPVPAVSSRSSRSVGTCAASARIVRASPASSSTVSPLVRSAIRKPAIWVSETSPCMISASTSAACSALRSPPRGELVDRAGEDRVGHQPRPRKLRQQLLALVGEHRLGVELHALGRQLAVAQSHQHAAAARGLLQAVGQLGVDHQRVVAARRSAAMTGRGRSCARRARCCVALPCTGAFSFQRPPNAWASA